MFPISLNANHSSQILGNTFLLNSHIWGPTSLHSKCLSNQITFYPFPRHCPNVRLSSLSCQMTASLLSCFAGSVLPKPILYLHGSGVIFLTYMSGRRISLSAPKLQLLHVAFMSSSNFPPKLVSLHPCLNSLLLHYWNVCRPLKGSCTVSPLAVSSCSFCCIQGILCDTHLLLLPE